MEHMVFSVIIPVFNESERINSLVRHLKSLEMSEKASLQLIVVDGSPEQETITAVEDPEVVTLTTEKGRASQMNAGAEKAEGGILLFLHADTKLPEKAFLLIQAALADRSRAGGAFSLELGTVSPLLQLIAWLTSLRSRLTRTPYGDQAIFVRAGVFRDVGGYPELPIMEDLEFMRRLRKAKHKISILQERVISSPRRWEKEGALRCSLRNCYIRSLYILGASPDKLVERYQ